MRLGLWLILLHLHISSYTTINFFAKKNFFFFFWMFVYFSEYDIRMFLLVLWLRNLFFGRHTCATGGIEKGSSKMCTGVQMGRGSENRSYDTYILNGWPQTNVVEYFLCIYSAKYTRTSLPARKMSLFSSIIITNILSYAIIRI